MGRPRRKISYKVGNLMAIRWIRRAGVGVEPLGCCAERARGGWKGAIDQLLRLDVH